MHAVLVFESIDLFIAIVLAAFTVGAVFGIVVMGWAIRNDRERAMGGSVLNSHTNSVIEPHAVFILQMQHAVSSVQMRHGRA